MFSQFKFNCPAVDVRVTVTRQTFTHSIIGTSEILIQHDHDCSREDTCEHRVTAVCRVRALNQAG
ncbi:hypothetical protein SAMN04487926_11839 [Paraburkholderia steynii]|uniref:Uncharacterized protein n=1 Tax=Paraburkholderia steynii TaxID=1245441 RepID=A0A7Z7BAZ1_9BURK|nr:hypothetical protein SAMN04487926_11839 [Paraburkholderia steynii]